VTAFTDFDPQEPLGPGRTVIEASAGTGKTFTISALVTRLIAEEGVPLEQILVVTFTNAATAELRDRIRKRMVETLRALTIPSPPSLRSAPLPKGEESHPPSGRVGGPKGVESHPPLGRVGGPKGSPGRGSDHDEHIDHLLNLAPAARTLAATRLQEALTHFDRAQIFTIHGFAQRLLGKLGLRARLSPDLEPGEPDEMLLHHVAGDLLVGRYASGNGDPPQSKDVVAIGRSVVGTPDARIVPDPAAAIGEAAARVELAHAMRAEVQRRMRSAGLVTFDDGLIEVRDTLADPEVGAAARELLARRYSVALVDESQDTDPIQWQVIRAVFDDSRLVVIGDPKQSIYSFRGADVESYLSALAGAAAKRTLRTNWRSDGPLLDALDALFAEATFGDDQIAYHRVRPAPDHTAARITGTPAPLMIRRFGAAIDIPKRKKDNHFYINEARQTVAADVAACIVELLNTGVTIEGEPLRPDHIAVLCRTGKQVDMMRAQLGLRGVPSVAARTGGVLASPAAEEWRRFLHGVESPERMTLVRLAAGSLLLGYSPQQVAALSDEECLDLQRQMQEWRTLLYEDGVPALVAAVDRFAGFSARVLATDDGERIITDLTHIAEEMHAAWRRRRTATLVAWLETAMAEATRRQDSGIEEAESRQRRLETDAAAVQVQTIHAAKGLQWPVVMVPYAWDVTQHRIDIPVFHGDQGMPRPGVARQRLIDVGGKTAPEFDEHVRLAQAEDAAEESRLLYVALTRAEHHLQVWWVENSDNTQNSKLNELLTARSPEALVAAAWGSLGFTISNDLPGIEMYRPSAAPPATLQRARFDRELDHHWRRASFSSLSPEHPIGVVAETSEQPTRSDETGLDDESDEIPVAIGESVLPMADLPRGARFGTLVHHVFEEVPFDAPNLEAAIRDALAPELQYATWDFDPEQLVAGLVAAMETPLGPDAVSPRLRDLDVRRVFDELTFELPVRTAAGTVSLRDIGDVMLQHLWGDDPYRTYAETLHDLPGTRFRGFLTGAIDLTAVLPGEHYVVMDYKSNPLPPRGGTASPLDYGPQQLAAAMIDGNYVLQATLYQVALHRYLQWRLRGYDPARHLGGSMYLFVRGMAGADAPVVDGERCGVARWQPPTEMITELSRLFAGGER